ncbi:hypothetical protein PHYPO_G00116390 [Pangasianodon hypophthalmus]|uniref:Uncharacterized protein n=1 Tax=Pangasianodon hypophthalmus TaxID=310915 RepID=A0A5N5L3A5_PANHP|nr:hypothetical protein PHYPO_G00116390 [Pangasianodon hypophthalmus]
MKTCIKAKPTDELQPYSIFHTTLLMCRVLYSVIQTAIHGAAVQCIKSCSYTSRASVNDHIKHQNDVLML